MKLLGLEVLSLRLKSLWRQGWRGDLNPVIVITNSLFLPAHRAACIFSWETENWEATGIRALEYLPCAQDHQELGSCHMFSVIQQYLELSYYFSTLNR